MNKNFAVLFLAGIILISSLIAVQGATSATSQKIFIKPDGSINPSTAPIRQVGNVYTFTANVNSGIVVECNNVAIDGAGYAFQGSGNGVAINMTCSNVTVQNVRIINWDAGVLGVFDNNTVKNNVITQCQSAFKIYAKYYVITRNDIENNNEAIRIGGGGQHFISNNNITKNAIGFSLFDSGNVIVENNINDCSDCAIILDNVGWTQTVYHNNFVNNTKDLTDYTSSHTPDRPLQNTLLPWDNGSSGNYWSNNTGADSNHDGIGDIPYEIPTYYSGIVVAPYGYVDRYPLIAPQNINGATPPIPSSLIPSSNTYLISRSDEQAKALSFLKDVLKLDLDKYKVTLQTVNGGAEYFHYSLYNIKSAASAVLEFDNGTLTWCNFNLEFGSLLLLTEQYSTNFDAAKTIIKNYQTWTNDNDVKKMLDLLNLAGSEKNTTEVAGNIDLKTLANQGYSTFTWSYTYNGADYSHIELNVENISGINSLMFSDNRAVYKIGNTDISITKQQVVAIAEDYVRRNFTYPMNFGNGTTYFVRGFNVSDANTTAILATASRDLSTLYPYWEVTVALDHAYPGHTIAVNVHVWADTGTVFQAQQEVDGSLFPSVPSLFTGIILVPLLGTIVIVVFSLVAILIVLVILLRRDRNNDPAKVISQ